MKNPPAGCDQQGRHEARRWPDTIATAWGDERQVPLPRIVPCSTLARWFLAVRRFLLG